MERTLGGRALRAREKGFDLVGPYTQDRINGFGDGLLDRLLEVSVLERAESVLDAMGGDGNLTERLYAYCARKRIEAPAKVAVLEYSSVQSEFAALRLRDTAANVIWGDLIAFENRADGSPLPEATFDRVIIKSGNHEIPAERQIDLYGNVLRLLRPGGSFINLGFAFDSDEERREFLQITRVKDGLAGLQMLVQNRYFLLRSELHELLREAGFTEIETAERCSYRIVSKIAAEQYFPEAVREELHYKLQAAQAMAKTLRHRQRIMFEPDHTVMELPAEITLARRPPSAPELGRIYEGYGYDFVRNIEAHRILLDEAAFFVRPGASVLDLGCGPGLLAERLVGLVGSYRGVDMNPAFIRAAASRFSPHAGLVFEVGDIESSVLPEETYDVAALINVIYHAGIRPVSLLRRVRAALQPGGLVIVSGPNDRKSFLRAEPLIRAQLERDGCLAGNEESFAAIARANEGLLGKGGNFWSAEGMAELLMQLGFRQIVAHSNEIFYGTGYLVVARV